jgi:hypothetical protein
MMGAGIIFEQLAAGEVFPVTGARDFRDCQHRKNAAVSPFNLSIT